MVLTHGEFSLVISDMMRDVLNAFNPLGMF